MSRPFVIWVNVVISSLCVLPAVWGLLAYILVAPRMLQTDGVWGTTIVMAVQVGETAFLAAVVYASLVRPRWGHTLCGLFAVLLAVVAGYVAVLPDPHPLIAIRPGEEAGAFAGRWAVVFLLLMHAYFIVFGAKARSYFGLSLAAHDQGD